MKNVYLLENKCSMFSLSLKKLLKDNSEFNPFKNKKSFDKWITTTIIIRDALANNKELKKLHSLIRSKS